MKQVWQEYRTGQLRVGEVPIPTLRRGQVLVQTAFSLISAGTEKVKVDTARMSLLAKARSRPDLVRKVMRRFKTRGLRETLRAVRTRLDAPTPLGYSLSGVVLQVTPDVTGIKPGDRVACGGTSANHAQVVAVPALLCTNVPDNVSMEQAAFTTLGSIALQGFRLAQVSLGEIVVVVGLGLVGQIVSMIARANGCKVIGFDPAEAMIEHAVAGGFDRSDFVTTETTLERRVAQVSGKRGADAVIICAATRSNRPVELAGELCRDHGKVVVVGAVGMTVPRDLYYAKELHLCVSRSYGPGRYDVNYEEKGHDYPYGFVRWTEGRNMACIMDLVATSRLDFGHLITHRFAVEQAAEAYELLAGQHGTPHLGIMLTYGYPDQKAAAHADLSIPFATGSGTSAAVIGAGSFAQSVLIPELREAGLNLAAVATMSGLSAEAVRNRFGFRTATSPEAILEDASISAVVIATRHADHAGLVARALRAGKAVFVEKPLAISDDDCEVVEAAYRERPNLLMVGFNRRFSPLAVALKEAFDGLPLTMTFRVNAGGIPDESWLHDIDDGGGRILGEVCHFVDFLCYFASSPVTSVFASAMPSPGKPLQSSDSVSITLNFTDGSVGHILYASQGSERMPKERFEVFGGGQSGIIDDFRAGRIYQPSGDRVIKLRNQDKGHHEEVRRFASALKGKGQPPMKFQDVMHSTRVTLDVIRSLAQGSPIIRVP